MDFLKQGSGLWDGDDPRNKAIPPEKWDTRDPDQNFYGVNDPRRGVRETTNRWSKKGSEVIDRIPEPVKEVVGGVTNVVGQGLFGPGGLLRSDMNALGLQPVDALRAVDAGFETTAKLTGINRNVLETGEALVPFVPPTAKLAKTVTKRAGQKVINELTEAAFRAADPDSVIGMTYRTGGGFGVVPSDDWFLKNSDEFIDTPAFPGILTEGVPNYLKNVDTGNTGYNWIRKGGELDQHLDDVLKVKAKTTIDGKVFKKGDVLTYDQLPKTKKDIYDSLLATGPAIDADDVLFYGFGKNPPSSTAGMKGAAGWSPQLDKSMEFHHKSMKALQRNIHSRARQLRDLGDATDADLLNLHGLSNSFDAPSGSRKSAGVFMNRMTHDVLHKKRMLPSGIQPDHIPWSSAPLKAPPKGFPPKLFRSLKKVDKKLNRFDLDYIENWSGTVGMDKAIAKWKKFKYDSKGNITKGYTALGPDDLSELGRMSKKIKTMNIKELMSYQKELLEEITVPMTKTAEKLEDYFSTFSSSEQLGFRTGKNTSGLDEGFNTWQRRLEDIDEVRRDQNILSGG